MTKLNIWRGGWWNNFCQAHRAKQGSLHLDELNEHLASWGGQIKDVDAVSIAYVEFENDADATAFLLRWS